ncbi:17.6 kDa class I heat shock protein 2 [Forsythia ovata]|uniref:17.6 kDa class I heat shock protein 2 n=1 Tax=Forsythia ovata TaxID=205694 RepID=A0ABD1X844_9LAMI
MSLIPSVFGRRSNVFDPISLDLWDPFQDWPFSSALSAPVRSDISNETSQFAATRIDWKETPEGHMFKADLPGLKKEEISGERNSEKEDKNDTWHRTERSSRKFIRRFRLPKNAKMDQIKASIENGVLTVTVPKEEVKKADIKPLRFLAEEDIFQ